MDSIKALPALSGRLSCDGGLIGKLSVGVSAEHDSYAGDYEITPPTAEQTILPDEGYNYLSQVVVAAIPYAESENAAGGITATIG